MRTKALEWVKHPHANLWRADCLTGRYQVYAITSPITWGFDGFDGLTEVFGESPTEEAAKTAAQSHFDAAVSSVLDDDWQTMETARKLAYACHERMASLRDRMGIHYLREHVEREVRDTFEIVRLLSPPAEPNNSAPWVARYGSGVEGIDGLPSPPKAGE